VSRRSAPGPGFHVRFDPAQIGDDGVLAGLRALPSVSLRTSEPVEATLEDVFLAAADRGAEQAIRGAS